MKLKPLISKEQIAAQIKKTALQIQKDYANQDLVIVMVLKGALCLVADLIRELELPLHLEAVQCSSYGANGALRGNLEVIGIERLNVHNRDVLLVDDIFDSGQTMKTLIDAIKTKGARSVKSCTLLYKRGVAKVTDYQPEYILFTIENLFVVGYGLDYKEEFRGLSAIHVLDLA
jgi:hypoxanthine phosphoribosyltransferase